MMKNIFIINDYAGSAGAYGVGTYIEELERALSSSGFRTHIVTLHAKTDELKITSDNDRFLIDIPRPLQGNNYKRYYGIGK